MYSCFASHTSIIELAVLACVVIKRLLVNTNIFLFVIIICYIIFHVAYIVFILCFIREIC